MTEKIWLVVHRSWLKLISFVFCFSHYWHPLVTKCLLPMMFMWENTNWSFAWKIILNKSASFTIIWSVCVSIAIRILPHILVSSHHPTPHPAAMLESCQTSLCLKSCSLHLARGRSRRRHAAAHQLLNVLERCAHFSASVHFFSNNNKGMFCFLGIEVL